MSVLALALRRREMSQRDSPSTVPAGQALDGGTNGTSGTNGTVGTSGTAFPEGEAIDTAAVEERAALAADRVPAIYLDAWARLNCDKPLRMSEAEWRLALDEGGRFLDAWGERVAEVGWTSENLFSPASGLLWRLNGATVETLGADHLRLNDGRTIWRSQRMGGSSGEI
jgi:hypothetical protein